MSSGAAAVAAARPAAAGWKTTAVALIEAMLDAVWLVDPHSFQVVAANAAAGTLLGGEPRDLLGRDVLSFAATPEDLFFWEEAALDEASQIESQSCVRRFDGSIVPVLRRARRIELAGSSVYLVVLHDRSEATRIERELEDRAAELAATLESTADGILVTDRFGNLRSFNRKFAELWGVPEELLLRRDDDAVLTWMRRHVADPVAYMRRLAVIDDSETMQSTDTLTLLSGKVLERVTQPQSSRGQPIGRVFCFRDITERIEATQRIDALAHTDPLTGLPNRRVLTDRLEHALAIARREGTPFALLFVNLDRFKHVNDTLGHAFGDRVLVDVAERMKSCVRQVDTVARVAGDEFVLVAHQADARGAEATARRVLAAMQMPFSHGELSFTLTCSIGIALCPRDGSTQDELVGAADAAMQLVKESGRDSFRFHERRAESDTVDPRSRMKLDHAMRQALAAGYFRLHYQPQVDIDSGEVIGAEALLRWNDPELGQISPGEFIPVAEESGFIVAIGDWVLREAVRQAAQWQSNGRRMLVSVNVSALQFQQSGFVDGVAAAVSEAGLDPQWLELELTESILLQEAHETLSRLQALAALGVKLAIDDFGTGFSSLGYLKRFPIRRLKIDRSFVKGLPGDESDAGIVNAIVNLGRALNLGVIAEGVETEGQRAFLQQAGCREFQGFLCAPALAPDVFEERFRAPGGSGSAD